MKREKGEFELEKSYFFEEKFTKLKSDFDKYSQGFDAIKGNWYNCYVRDTRLMIQIFLKFDEIVFIRASQYS